MNFALVSHRPHFGMSTPIPPEYSKLDARGRLHLLRAKDEEPTSAIMQLTKVPREAEAQALKAQGFQHITGNIATWQGTVGALKQLLKEEDLKQKANKEELISSVELSRTLRPTR